MKDSKKEEILKVAETLFNRFGIKKTAVDEIANRARVAKGTIYNYFGDKEGLIKELIKEKIRRFEEILEKSFPQVKDPLVKVKLTLTERIKLLINNPFISDKTLNSDENIFSYIFEELDNRARSIINSIIESDISEKISHFEKKRIINTIQFTLRGIEETIRSRFESVSPDIFEKDIEYLIMAIFSKYCPST